MRARSGAVTAGAAGDLARGDVEVASLVQMSASDMAGAVASPAEETPGDASVGRAAGDRRLDCHEFRMRLQLHALCAIHTAITFIFTCLVCGNSDSRCSAARRGSTAPGCHGHQTTPR